MYMRYTGLGVGHVGSNGSLLRSVEEENFEMNDEVDEDEISERINLDVQDPPNFAVRDGLEGQDEGDLGSEGLVDEDGEVIFDDELEGVSEEEVDSDDLEESDMDAEEFSDSDDENN